MRKTLLLTTLSIAAISATSNAQILFDFGTTPATGQVTVDATAAPSLGGPAGLTGNLTYNVISGTDNNNTTMTFPSSYQLADGTAAPGVSVSITTGTSWATMANGPAAFQRVGVPGGRSGVGVFATPASPNNSNLFSDFAAAANANGTNDYVGISISGLAPGTYTIYTVANNTYLQTVGNQTRDIRAGVGTAGLTDYSGFAAPTTLAYNFSDIAADTASWAAAEGKYWTSFSLTITPTDNTLYLGGFKLGDNQGGVFNAIQVIPEPSTYAALLGLLALGVVAWRRRRKA